MANANSIAEASAPPGRDGGMIPLLPAAVKVATAVVKAAKGEDWREAFRTKADDYQLYQEAKREAAAGK